MKLSTVVKIQKSQVEINHQDAILLIGSCFTESIGDKLVEYKFNTHINPFGIIYNPISIFNVIKRTSTLQLFSESDLFEFNKKWQSFDHHGSFSSSSKTECLKNINTSLIQVSTHFKNCHTLFISLGSAWVYEYPKKGIVANCHKIPNKEFNKRLLTVKEIIAAFDDIKSALKDINVVFTISPVRHVKDGLHENNLSKSTLLLAIHNIVEQNDNCSYFPAYELIIDELRDYRFYKDDLVHPTELAVKYVWEKFCSIYFNESTNMLNEAIEKMITASYHRAFDFDSEAHQKFVTVFLDSIERINEDHPFLDFTAEKMRIQNK